jgi:hypothetical protein
MLPHLAHDRAFVSRFNREATIAARLHHPSIARVLGAGRVGVSRYMTMELVRGETLAGVIGRQRRQGCPMPHEVVRRVGAAVASALDWAHELDDDDGRPLYIVHRDVSPQNVMLGYDGSVKLIDFGVARWAASTTRTGSLAGKIGYFSPEQVRGTRIDRRTDIYSLGVVLYEALLGEAVFTGQTELAIMQAILHSAPPEIPDVHPRLRLALHRAMSKEPANRFSSAKEFAQALFPDATVDNHRAIGRQDAVVAAYMQRLFPDGMRRWSKIVDQAAAGIPFDDELSSSSDRALMTAETVAVTMPGDPVPRSFAGGLTPPVRSDQPQEPHVLAAVPLLAAISWNVRSRLVPVTAGLLGLMLVCIVVAARRPNPLVLLPAPSASDNPIARAERHLLAPEAFTRLDPRRSNVAGVAASTIPVPLPTSTGQSHGPHDVRARRTTGSKRSALGAPQAGARHHRRSSAGGRSGSPGSIADQLEPSPYAWSSR